MVLMSIAHYARLERQLHLYRKLAVAQAQKAAEAILTRIEKDLDLLVREPQLGGIPGDEELVRMGYRYLIVKDYLVFYTFEEQTVLVHHIIRGARDFLRLL